MTGVERAEVTASAIARLAGVGRAAVSNWRRRYPDFPKPVGGSAASPLFSWEQVHAWLAATGKAGQLATLGRTDTGTQRLDRADRSRPVTERDLLAGVLASLLPRMAAQVDVYDEPGDEDVVDFDDDLLPVVVDPACGDGVRLAAVADRFGDRVRLVGQEINDDAAATAVLLLRERDGAYQVVTGDSLLDNRLAAGAAAVVCAPPVEQARWPVETLTTDPRWVFGIPERRDGELAWVQHCYGLLRPRGVAVVAVSARICVQPSAQAIRAKLVRAGVLRDVIALPKSHGGRCLWVLQRPHLTDEVGPVWFVHLSEADGEGAVPRDHAEWQRLLTGGDEVVAAVPRLALLDADTVLLPSRHVRPVAAGATDLAHVTDRLRALYTHVGADLPVFTGSATSVLQAMVTMGELERVGAVTIRSRDTTPRKGDVLLRTLGRPPVVASGTDADDDGVAQVVEVDSSRLDPHFIAMFLRPEVAAFPVANTAGAVSRDDLRRCRVPRLPLAEQRRYGAAFGQLSDLRDMLIALAETSANVLDQTIHGLTTGVLAPETASRPTKNGTRKR